jgi:hypothetical protein
LEEPGAGQNSTVKTGQFWVVINRVNRSCSDWWTQEQLAYVGILAKNIMAKMINENFIRPLKRTFQRPSSSIVSIRFEGKEMKQQEPWISSGR